MHLWNRSPRCRWSIMPRKIFFSVSWLQHSSQFAKIVQSTVFTGLSCLFSSVQCLPEIPAPKYAFWVWWKRETFWKSPAKYAACTFNNLFSLLWLIDFTFKCSSTHFNLAAHVFSCVRHSVVKEGYLVFFHAFSIVWIILGIYRFIYFHFVKPRHSTVESLVKL